MVKMQQQQPQGPTSAQRAMNGGGAGGVASPRPSHPPAPHFPPPYRSPPHPAILKQQLQQQGAYSKFNVSEPNIVGNGGFLGSPLGYRHTINAEHSQHMQHGLRNLLNTPQSSKHQTMDSASQNQALQHLRNHNGLASEQHRLQNLQGKLPLPGDTYVSPDNLRDAANRIFTRNHQERASFGVAAPTTPQHQQHHHQQHMNGNAAEHTKQPFYSNHQTQQQQQNKQQRSMKDIISGRFNKNPSDEAKRHSFTNQSFRKAVAGQQDQQKTPPQVPPKPNSRSTSRERLKESLEEVDHIDQELKHILRGGGMNTANIGNRLSLGGGTPPLPALSPDPTPDSSPNQNSKNVKPGQGISSFSNSRPDLLDSGLNSKRRSSGTLDNQSSSHLKAGMRKYKDEMTSQATMSGLTADLESVLGLQTDLTSDESTTIDMSDAAAIRSQLDGLESMYAEVLKLLGLRKYGRAPQQQTGLDGRRRKLYGSMSSLPSVSSIGSRPLYKDRRGGAGGGRDKRPGSAGGREKSNNKRFQRLESHVVTLARSVAHLSSEMRNQQLLIQEVEALRLEMQQMRGPRGYVDPENFFAGAAAAAAGAAGQGAAQGVNRVQANRVRKLTKFFGDEPPLLRLFLKNLGYEKYASVFEEAKIGLLELPYLSDERLDKLGIPMGPRMRILQEAKVSIANEPNYNVYIL